MFILKFLPGRLPWLIIKEGGCRTGRRDLKHADGMTWGFRKRSFRVYSEIFPPKRNKQTTSCKLFKAILWWSFRIIGKNLSLQRSSILTQVMSPAAQEACSPSGIDKFIVPVIVSGCLWFFCTRQRVIKEASPRSQHKSWEVLTG